MIGMVVAVDERTVVAHAVGILTNVAAGVVAAIAIVRDVEFDWAILALRSSPLVFASADAMIADRVDAGRAAVAVVLVCAECLLTIGSLAEKTQQHNS